MVETLDQWIIASGLNPGWIGMVIAFVIIAAWNGRKKR